MSLVGTYVRAEDGQLYRGPVIYGDGWFVCFDDDDPPELVVFEGTEVPSLPWLRLKGKANGGGSRCVPPTWEPMAEANSYWCKLLAPIPVPELHDGTTTKDKIMQGVVYDPGKRGT